MAVGLFGSPPAGISRLAGQGGLCGAASLRAAGCVGVDVQLSLCLRGSLTTCHPVQRPFVRDLPMHERLPPSPILFVPSCMHTASSMRRGRDLQCAPCAAPALSAEQSCAFNVSDCELLRPGGGALAEGRLMGRSVACWHKFRQFRAHHLCKNGRRKPIRARANSVFGDGRPRTLLIRIRHFEATVGR